MNKLKSELFEKGYVKISNLIDKDLLTKTNNLTTNLVNQQSEEDKKKQVSTGSMISVSNDESFLNLIVNDELLKIFSKMGYSNPKWSSGYIIGKTANSAPLYWHTDWWAWDDPISFAKKPPMIFVIIAKSLNFTTSLIEVIYEVSYTLYNMSDWKFIYTRKMTK